MRHSERSEESSSSRFFALRAQKIAGTFILLSLLLAYYVHPAWLWFTAFVGLNLFQSAFTNWCPMMWLLKRLGVQ